jgi:hypothetical protein
VGDSAGSIYIGSNGTTGYATNCYISDLRIIKGSIPAEYVTASTTVNTGVFTPPTEPLTAIANTSLLTCQTNQPVNNNVFIDNSTNNFLITRNGNATQGTFSPYGENWSNYFDGTGDFLNIPAGNSALSLGTGDFTIEFFFYKNDKNASVFLSKIKNYIEGKGGVPNMIINWNNSTQNKITHAEEQFLTETINNSILVQTVHGGSGKMLTKRRKLSKRLQTKKRRV